MSIFVFGVGELDREWKSHFPLVRRHSFSKPEKPTINLVEKLFSSAHRLTDCVLTRGHQINHLKRRLDLVLYRLNNQRIILFTPRINSVGIST